MRSTAYRARPTERSVSRSASRRLRCSVPASVPFAFGVLVLGVCDSLAALVGGRYGRRVVPLVETHKTLWGTGTFLVACFALGVMLMLPTGASVCARRRGGDGDCADSRRALPHLRPRQPRPPDRGRVAPRRAMRVVEVVYLISPLLVAGAVHAPVIKRTPSVARPPARLRPHPPRRADPRLQQDMARPARHVDGRRARRSCPVRALRAGTVPRDQHLRLLADELLALGLALGISHCSSSSPTASSSAGSNPPAERRARGRSYNTSSTRPTRRSAAPSRSRSSLVRAVGTLLLVFAVGFVLHVVMDQAFFLFAVKRHPSPSPAPRLEGSPTC